MFKQISSREILCFFLSVVFSVGVSLAVLSMLISFTICNEKYLVKLVDSPEVSSYNSSVYKERIAVLAQDSEIPTEVFENVDSIIGYSDGIITKFINGDDTSLYTQDRINAYEQLCKEYLDGNEIEYDKASVHETAVKAARIYSESFGVINVEPFKAFIDMTHQNVNKVMSSGLVLVIVSILLTLSLFNDKKKTRRYFAGSTTASGLLLIIVGLISLISKTGSYAKITPDVYASAISDAVSDMYIIFIIVGLIITAVSVYASLYINSMISKSKKKH